MNPVRRKTLLQHCIAKQNAYFARYILEHNNFSLSTLFFRDPNGLDTLDALIIEPKDFDFAPYMVEQILGLKNMQVVSRLAFDFLYEKFWIRFYESNLTEYSKELSVGSKFMQEHIITKIQEIETMNRTLMEALKTSKEKGGGKKIVGKDGSVVYMAEYVNKDAVFKPLYEFVKEDWLQTLKRSKAHVQRNNDNDSSGDESEVTARSHASVEVPHNQIGWHPM